MLTQRSHVLTAIRSGLVLAIVLSACGPAPSPTSSPAPTASPGPTIRPTPTPIAANVGSPEDAAALVIATDPRFAGAMPLTPDVIGASRWWVATPLEGGGYRIELTIGWGDCPAGCINKHVWTFDVQPDGQLKLVGEVGDEVPAELPS